MQGAFVLCRVIETVGPPKRTRVSFTLAKSDLLSPCGSPGRRIQSVRSTDRLRIVNSAGLGRLPKV